MLYVELSFLFRRESPILAYVLQPAVETVTELQAATLHGTRVIASVAKILRPEVEHW